MLGRSVIAVVLCTLGLRVQTSDALETPDIIKADGFPAETHSVTTIDGYILKMYRIPYGRGDSRTTGRPVVFLMHGLMSSSDAFVGLGPDYSFAYNLADAGFDVWIGNARGNKYSRSHVTLNPDDDVQKFTFFDFTFEEIGIHDLPTMIDYALAQTGKTKLHYIGHSQGGTVFLVMGALQNAYLSKITSAHLLAGVGYQQYFPNEELAANAIHVDLIYSTALSMGIVELYPEFLEGLSPEDGYSMADYCTGNVKERHMCELFGIRHLLRQDADSDNVITPGGASLKQAAHYGQNIRDKLFRRYHYGIENNLVVYGLTDPPLYDIKLITTDVTMHYTVNDNVLDERDVLAMAADMRNTKVRKVARESFLHEDFLAAIDAKELVTDYIIEALKNTSNTADVGSTTTGVDGVIVVNPSTTVGDSNTLTTDAATNTVTTVADTTTAPADVTLTTPSGNFAANIIVNTHLVLLSLFLILK